MDKPGRLYKYQPFTTQALANLKDRRLWFSRPARFNDPFDCTIRIDRREIEPADLVRIYLDYRRQAEDPMKEDAVYLTGGKPNERFASLVLATVDAVFENRTNELLNSRGVCCFAESPAVPLMWSHYADGHRGFCLEFDTQYDPFHRVHRVEYSSDIPQVSPAEFLLNPADAPFMGMITTKADCWSYEQEWRAIHAEPDKSYGYSVRCLTGLYFGSAMPYEHIEIICLVLAGAPTKFYQVRKSSTSFELDIGEVHYTPYDYAGNHEA